MTSDQHDGTLFVGGLSGRLHKIALDSGEQASTAVRTAPVCAVDVREGLVLTGSAAGTLAVTEARTLLPACTLRVGAPVAACCWAAGFSNVLCCGCRDGATRLYDIRSTAAPLATLRSHACTTPVVALISDTPGSSSSASSSSASNKTVLLAGSADGVFACTFSRSDEPQRCAWHTVCAGACTGLSRPVCSTVAATFRVGDTATAHKVCHPGPPFSRLGFHLLFCCCHMVSVFFSAAHPHR